MAEQNPAERCDQQEHHAGRARRQRNRELAVIITAVQPGPPAVGREPEIQTLEPHIGVQPRVVENDCVQCDADHGERPAPDDLAHRQVDR